MSEFYKRFLLSDPAPGGAAFVALGAFGKHPGWDDHIEDLGLETESLLLAKKLFYVEGVGGQIDTGGWEKLKEEHRLPGFDHTFVWERAGQFLLGRMWSSSDGKGRTRYPMIVCAHCMGVPLGWALAKVLPKLRELEQACQATRSAAEVRSLLEAGRGFLRTLVAGLGGAETAGAPGPASRKEFIASPKFGTGREGLLRVVYALQTQGAAFAPGRFNLKGDLSELRAQQLRVPLTTPFVVEGVQVWSAFFDTQVDRLVPRLWFWGENRGWLDVTFGQPTVHEFLALRAGLGAIPLTADVPYDLESSFRDATNRQLDQFAGLPHPPAPPASPVPRPTPRAQASDAGARAPSPPPAKTRKGWPGVLGGKVWLAAALVVVGGGIAVVTWKSSGPGASPSGTQAPAAGAVVSAVQSASGVAPTTKTAEPPAAAAGPTEQERRRAEEQRLADAARARAAAEAQEKARQAAEAEAKRREEARQAAEAKAKQEAEARLAAEAEAKRREEARLAAEAERKRAAEQEAAQRAAEAQKQAEAVKTAAAAVPAAPPPAAAAAQTSPTAPRPARDVMTNSVGMVLVWVAGVPETAEGAWVGKFEVTQAEFERVMGTNPSAFPGPRRPADSVSWRDAVAFCDKLTAAERVAGQLPPGYAYGLPTQRQWEFVLGDGSFAQAVTSVGLAQPRLATAEVGTLPANRFGLHDILGNVWEWCADANPEGKLPYRGAAYKTTAYFKFRPLQPTTVWWDAPETRSTEVGFRCWLLPRP